MTLEEARDKLAAALLRAVAEHGRPNSFRPGELEQLYGGPPAMLAGRVLRRYRHSLWVALGGVEWGPEPPTYLAGKIEVDAKEPRA